MNERTRATYRAIGWAFLGVAAGVIAIRIGEVAFGFAFFRGSPLPTALFLAGIGGLLVWTVRGAADADGAEGGDPAGDGGGGPAPFRLEDLGSVRPSGGAVDGIPPESIRREVEGEGADAAADGGSDAGDGAALDDRRRTPSGSDDPADPDDPDRS